MDNTFMDEERLYRAVYPQSIKDIFWKKDGTLSSAAFADKNGLSVEREYDREKDFVIDSMKEKFEGSIVSVSALNCKEVEAVVRYMPSKNNKYHSEIHGGENEVLLRKGQRRHLAQVAKIDYAYEKIKELEDNDAKSE